MALITCPECGQQVSDKAEVCIHCGYPLSKIRNSKPQEKQKYDLILCNCGTNVVGCAKAIETYKHVDLQTALKIAKSDKEEVVYTSDDYHWLEIITREFEKVGSRMKIENHEKYYTPKERELRCPKCQSSSITTGTRGFKLTTGFIGANKVKNFCSKCGYSWEP